MPAGGRALLLTLFVLVSIAACVEANRYARNAWKKLAYAPGERFTARPGHIKARSEEEVYRGSKVDPATGHRHWDVEDFRVHPGGKRSRIRMRGVQVRETILLEDETSIVAVHCAHAPHDAGMAEGPRVGPEPQMGRELGGVFVRILEVHSHQCAVPVEGKGTHFGVCVDLRTEKARLTDMFKDLDFENNAEDHLDHHEGRRVSEDNFKSRGPMRGFDFGGWKPQRVRRQHNAVANWQPPRPDSKLKPAHVADAAHSVRSGMAAEQRYHQAKAELRDHFRVYAAGPPPVADDEPYTPSSDAEDPFDEFDAADSESSAGAGPGTARRGLRWDLFKAIGDGFRKAGNAIKKGFEKVGNAIKKGINKAVNWVKNTAGPWLKKNIVEPAKKAIDTAKQWVKDAANEARKFVGKVVDGAKGFLDVIDKATGGTFSGVISQMKVGMDGVKAAGEFVVNGGGKNDVGSKSDKKEDKTGKNIAINAWGTISFDPTELYVWIGSVRGMGLLPA
eukprot:tig00000826_g4598.t1